jgi:hypothetical protein
VSLRPSFHPVNPVNLWIRELLLVIAGFTLLTIALTSPQIAHMSSHMGWHYDTLFSVWRLAWIAHQLPRDPVHLFDANIFYPAHGTLAYSDAILLQGLLGAPFIWLGVEPIFVHNSLLLLSFVASGVAMYVLVRELTGAAIAAWVAAVVFAFQPYRFEHYPQLELLWGWWIPLSLWALHRTIASGRLRYGLVLGLTIALQVWSCLYYAVFLGTALAILTPILLLRRSQTELKALVVPFLAASAVCALLVGPYAAAYIESRETVGTRGEQDIREWSPRLTHYLAVPRGNWLYGDLTGHLGHLEGVMFPGVVAVGLATAGIWGFRDRTRIAYAVLLVVAFDLSLGFNGLGYRTLYSVMLPYRGLRVPARMFVVVSAALAVLGGYGVVRLLDRVRQVSVRRVLGVALAASVMVESTSTPMNLQEVPETPRLYAWLEKQPPALVMEWPLPRASSLGHTHDPLYMYYSTAHWHRLVNGYSGFYPPSYIRLVETVWRFPRREAVDYMKRLGIRYVILHEEFAPRQYTDIRAQLANHLLFEWLFTEGDAGREVTVYRVH